MKVITAVEELTNDDMNKVKIFLAGGITNCRNWQQEVIKEIQDRYFEEDLENMIIINPRRENFPIGDKSESVRQIDWEFRMLERCDIFTMYFCSGESDQPICMYELGRNIIRMQTRYPFNWEHRIVVSSESEYKRRMDVNIQVNLATQNRIKVNSAQVVNKYTLDDHIKSIYTAYKRLLINGGMLDG